jgi:hypothetical protein
MAAPVEVERERFDEYRLTLVSYSISNGAIEANCRLMNVS